MEPRRRGRPRLAGVRVRGPYQRRDGRWQVDTREADGSRGCRTFSRQDEAQVYADELLATVRQTSPVTIAEALREYRVALEARGLKPVSIKSALEHLERYFPDRNLRLRSLGVSRVRQLYQALVDDGLSPGAHQSYLATARTFLNWCVAEGMIETNPAKLVKAIGRARRGKPQHRIDELRLWEREAFRRASEGDQAALAALLALYLGMRASEITLRVVRDVDDGGRVLWIPGGKTDAARRALDVPAVLVPMLARLVRGRPREAVLFAGTRTTHRNRTWVRHAVRDICEAANVPNVSAHAMRGALATLAAQRGQLGHLAAMHFGHTSVRMTKRAYAAPGSVDSGTRARGAAVLKGRRSA